MAAYVLTSQGLNVLLVEAGKKVNTTEVLHSMEWPYDHPRRGQMSPKFHALSRNEYNIRNPPYAQDSKYEKVFSYVQGWGGSDYSKTLVVDEKDHPYSGTNYAWVRARVLGGKTNIWGRLALRLSDYDFKGKSHDGYGEDWPIGYADVAPYYDKVDLLLGISGVKENLPQLPDGKFQRPYKLTPSEVQFRHALQKMGRTATPYRAGVTTDGVTNKYRSKCFGRGACSRRAGGCDIHAAFDSPTGLIYPAQDTGHLSVRTNATVHEVTVDPATGKARGVGFVDTVTGKSLRGPTRRSVVLAASTLESARLLMLSKSTQHPNGIGNSSGLVGHHFCEHLMGPARHRPREGPRGRHATLDDGRPGGFYVPRFRNLTDKQPDFIRGYGFEGEGGVEHRPWRRRRRAGIRQVVEEARARLRRRVHQHGRLRRSAAALREQRQPRSGDQGPVGHPGARSSTTSSATTSGRWLPTWRSRLRRCSRRPASRWCSVGKNLATEGWSIHELGTARMGSDPKTSVLNQFQQSHDVKQPFRRRRQQPRERVVPEPDVDDHGARDAVLRAPGGSDEEGRAVMEDRRTEVTRARC